MKLLASLILATEKKRKNRGLMAALFMALLFAAGICETESVRAEAEETIRIGIESGELDYNTSFHILNENLRHLEKLANVEFVRPNTKMRGDSNEHSIYNVENLIEQNVQGVLFSPATDQILPAICRLCEEKEVYWGIYFRSILDKKIEKLCKASPYYIGNTYENEVQGAYDLAKSVLEKGYRKFALLSEPKWNNSCRLREEGFQRALMEYEDAELVVEARGMNSLSDVEENTKSILQAYPNLDCIFLAGTQNAGGAQRVLQSIQAVRRTNRVSLIAIDFSDTLAGDFQTGILKSAYGLLQLTEDPYYLAIKMINTLKGYPLEERSTSHCIEGVLITSQEQAEKLSCVIEDRSLLFFEDDFIESTLFKWNNPSLNEQKFQEIIDENYLFHLNGSSGNVSMMAEP